MEGSRGCFGSFYRLNRWERVRKGYELTHARTMGTRVRSASEPVDPQGLRLLPLDTSVWCSVSERLSSKLYS